MKIIALAAIGLVISAPAVASDFTVLGQASAPSFTYLKIEWSSVDGATERGVLRLACTGGIVTSAAVHSPRDAATGQSSGKRMHKPVTFVKEWGAAPANAKKGSWDLATSKGGKTMASDDWEQVSISGMNGACAAPPTGKVNYQDISFTR